MANCGSFPQRWDVMARSGMARPGPAGHGLVRLGWARQGHFGAMVAVTANRQGRARQGWVRRGEARQGLFLELVA